MVKADICSHLWTSDHVRKDSIMQHYCFRREFLRDADIASSAPTRPYPALSEVTRRAPGMPTLALDVRVPASGVPAPAPRKLDSPPDISDPASRTPDVFNTASHDLICHVTDTRRVARDSPEPASGTVHPASYTPASPARDVLYPARNVLDSCSDALDSDLFALDPAPDVPHHDASDVSASSSCCHGCDETEVKLPVSSGSTHPIRVQRFHSDNEVTLGQRSDLSYSEGAQPNKKDKSEYDFYLAVAEKDLEQFGLTFADMVETRMGMRPCLTLRDIIPGKALYETMAETLETRCNGKVVFVLSKNFMESDECLFLVHFAKTLDPYAKQQKLIPLVIDKGVQLPRVLEGLVCINYNAAMRENWLGKKLWEAVHGGSDQRTNHRRRTLSSPCLSQFNLI